MLELGSEWTKEDTRFWIQNAANYRLLFLLNDSIVIGRRLSFRQVEILFAQGTRKDLREILQHGIALHPDVKIITFFRWAKSKNRRFYTTKLFTKYL